MTYADAARLVALRGDAMQKMAPGGMLSVVCGEEEARAFCGEGVELAALNSPTVTVLAGPNAVLDALEARLAKQGLKSKRLRTSHAFHSAMMEPAVAAMREAIRGTRLSAPQRTIVSTVTGRVLTAVEAQDKEYWARQLRETVRFSAALDALSAMPPVVALEVGPGTALATLALQHEQSARLPVRAALPGAGAEETAETELLAAIGHCWVHGAAVEWEREWPAPHPRRVALPTYPFERTRHWVDIAPSAAVEARAGAAAPDASVEARIVAVLEDTSGFDLKSASRDAAFSELGFDSLLLTQVSTALRRAFGVEVSFRVLLEEATNIAALSARLATAVPATATAAAPAPKKTQHTPGTRITREPASAHSLQPAQRAFIEKLISEYVAATSASKAFTQQHRKRLADPRTVSGFNPLWKEMVYPIVTDRSKGSRVWDVDGREYIDFINGFGPIFFGHSPDFVTEAVLRQIESGIETGPQSPLAGEVAELFCEMTGNERVAFANTGSEGVIAALRLARTVTGREKVVMFEGAYHGIIDEVIVRAGRDGVGLPASPGVPRSHTANMIVLPYGTDESLARVRALAPELAAVIVEPVQSRHPGLVPVEFLRELRAITAASESALIFDEVVTGFRVHPGGVQALFDIRADLAVYGKVVAGGYPIGLLGGRARFLDALDGGDWQYGDDSIPEVGVTFFAGTFVRHPVALAAAKAVLLRLRREGPALQEGVAARTTKLVGDLRSYFASIRANVTIEGFSSYFYLAVGPDEPYGSLLFYMMRLAGIHAWEFRPAFVTTAHTDADLNAYKAAVIRAVTQLVRAGLLRGDVAALDRVAAGPGTTPPVPGARLGKDRDGMPAWFVPDPEREGRFLQVEGAESADSDSSGRP